MASEQLRRRRRSRWLAAAGAVAALAVSLVTDDRQRTAHAAGAAWQLHRGAVRQLAAGKLLVARRNLPDPNFSATVVFLVDYNREGAMGLVINRATDIPLSRMLGDGERQPAAALTAFIGGPVARTGVLALLRSTATCADCRPVLRDVQLITTRPALDQQIAAGAGADRFRVYLGYAGWGAGQLQAETDEGAWHVLDGDPAIIFDPNPDSMWRRQIARTEVIVARARDAIIQAPHTAAPF